MSETVVYIGGELPDKEASALRIMANAKALNEFGYNIVLIGEYKEKGKKEKSALKCEQYGPLRAYLTPMPDTTGEWIFQYGSIKKYVDIIEKENNVKYVIMYNPHAIVLEKMISYGRKKNIKVLADCTEWHTTYHLKGIRKLIKTFDVTRRIRTSQKKADGIIVIGSFFQKMYDPYIKTVVVPPLVDLSENKWNKTRDKSNTARFVYAGKLGIKKDSLNLCMKAFADIDKKQRFSLDVIGVTYEEYIKQFPDDEELLNSLAGKIKFYGRLSHTESLEYIKNASFSLLIRERNRKNDSGFPTKFVESISCGTPVIANDFSDIKEYIDEYNFGIMVSDIEDIKSGILKAINMNDEEYYAMAASCENSKIFDYHNYVNKMGDFISSL